MVTGRLDVAARFPPGDLIFQAKNSAARVWSANTFGNGVNLDVDDRRVLDLELMRRGLRKKGIFGLAGGRVSGAGSG